MKLGSELTLSEQQEVLRGYVHRYTKDHIPAWSRKEWKDGKQYPVQFASDTEWLNNTEFAVTPKGKLDHRVKECYSRPTWPDNPELRIKAA